MYVPLLTAARGYFAISKPACLPASDKQRGRFFALQHGRDNTNVIPSNSASTSSKTASSLRVRTAAAEHAVTTLWHSQRAATLLPSNSQKQPGSQPGVGVVEKRLSSEVGILVWFEKKKRLT